MLKGVASYCVVTSCCLMLLQRCDSCLTQMNWLNAWARRGLFSLLSQTMEYYIYFVYIVTLVIKLCIAMCKILDLSSAKKTESHHDF